MARRYNRQSRDEAFAATRRSIVEAAKGLHAELGVAGTSWHEIAKRARVSPVTVYRHFRSLAELIPACAQSFVDSVAPVTEKEARAAFAQLGSPTERLERLIRDDCACYQRGRDWFHAAMRESDLLPALGLVVSAQQATLRTLIRAALADESAPDELVASLQAIIDFPFWRALVDAGVPEADAPSVMLAAAEAQLSRARLSTGMQVSD